MCPLTTSIFMTNMLLWWTQAHSYGGRSRPQKVFHLHWQNVLDIGQTIWALSENSSPLLVSQAGYGPGWTLGSVPLRLVIELKILKEALQWRFQRRAQVESYVVTSIKPNKRSEPTIQCTSLL